MGVLKWTDLAQDKERWFAFANKLKNISVDEIREFLDCLRNYYFLKEHTAS
jgi:hypothetical protein